MLKIPRVPIILAAMVAPRQRSLRLLRQSRARWVVSDRSFELALQSCATCGSPRSSGRSIPSRRRIGFQRLVAEVGLGKVGLVLGVEMSRLARSCRDWHQLLEICALFDTLIADADGVYDPANYNDRLLLMSEAELHILKARMLEGRRAKARRGELGKAVPMGYLRRPSGEVVFDPDEQDQATILIKKAGDQSNAATTLMDPWFIIC
jgi:DNA invertase Pin-like site-specific DNA recombinase